MDKNSVLMLLDGKISNEHRFVLNDKLENIDEEKIKKIPLLPFKNPIIAAVLGFFFGMWGVDRFYQGNIVLGFVKVGIFLLGIATSLFFVGIFVLWGLGIYVLIDIYFVYKAVQNDNYQKILNVI